MTPPIHPVGFQVLPIPPIEAMRIQRQKMRLLSDRIARTLGRTGLQVGEMGLGTEHVVREDWYGCFLEGE
ncbi:MAG: hypothetical protein CVV48_03675 [Spirochaetae bacterium HGW-Spirochaetae-4]|jgi:hypothetical protein|nr:MAG: hypothetical protein CVV48_03675 [Spirochaetae bacterium HGW-Spirochaetae-4]